MNFFIEFHRGWVEEVVATLENSLSIKVICLLCKLLLQLLLLLLFVGEYEENKRVLHQKKLQVSIYLAQNAQSQIVKHDRWKDGKVERIVLYTCI